ncbi:restriction endonuclease subunit S [Helicobacter pylori]|uniref:restriction endonuclease subunit S n=1 Tax=Helicobacter pylori TaxID=210 RepID=UPI0015D66484|nr:restriction endonuclease subunit S [Helicobacter pylori]
MSEWQTFCLKDLGKIVGGATPPTNNPKNYGNKKGATLKKAAAAFHAWDLNHALVCYSQNMPFYFLQELL